MNLADSIPSEFIELFSNPNFQKAIKGYLYLIKEDPECRAEIKLQALNLIKEDPECRAEVKAIVSASYDEPEFTRNVEYALLDSESKILPRLKAVEIITGLKELTYIDEDEEREPNIREKINFLAERIENIELNKPATFEQSDNIIAETKTEKQAFYLHKYALEIGEVNGIICINNSDFNEFIKSDICKYDPELKAKPLQNTRKLKMDIINILKRWYGSTINIVKQKYGWGCNRIEFKPLQTVT
jgi:hypothetical protein